jgi:DNA-binding response OmpR family regulator
MSSLPQPEQRAEKGLILLVDHSRGALLFQETILRRRDMQIKTALAGSEGIARARDEKPNLIIFGYDLFDMTAPEFCREIRGDEATRGISDRKSVV